MVDTQFPEPLDNAIRAAYRKMTEAHNGDLAVGTITNGTIIANAYDLQSGTISAATASPAGVLITEAIRMLPNAFGITGARKPA